MFEHVAYFNKILQRDGSNAADWLFEKQLNKCSLLYENMSNFQRD